MDSDKNIQGTPEAIFGTPVIQIFVEEPGIYDITYTVRDVGFAFDETKVNVGPSVKPVMLYLLAPGADYIMINI